MHPTHTGDTKQAWSGGAPAMPSTPFSSIPRSIYAADANLQASTMQGCIYAELLGMLPQAGKSYLDRGPLFPGTCGAWPEVFHASSKHGWNSYNAFMPCYSDPAFRCPQTTSTNQYLGYTGQGLGHSMPWSQNTSLKHFEPSMTGKHRRQSSTQIDQHLEQRSIPNYVSH